MSGNAQTPVDQDQLLREVVLWIHSEFAAGRSEAQIRDDLIAQGIDGDVAERWVTAVTSASLESTGAQSSIWHRTKATVGGWGMFLLLFAGLNGILWGCQEVMSHDAKSTAVAMEIQMNSLEGRIDAMERRGRMSGLTDADAWTYENLIREYNAMVPAYNDVAKKAYSRWWLLPIPAPRAGRTRN